jgi:hypothetical protein
MEVQPLRALQIDPPNPHPDSMGLIEYRNSKESENASDGIKSRF